MAISAFVGLHGSGKSYGVVENVIVPAVKAKRVVWTNIPLNLQAFDDRYGVVPTIFDINDVKDRPDWFQTVLPKGALVIIDEAWRLWPQGMTVTKMHPGHQEFLAEHRHLVGTTDAFGDDLDRPLSTEIVIVVQRLNMLANAVRTQIHETYRCKKLTAAGSSKRYRVDIFEGAQDGNVPIEKRLREIYGKFSKNIYELYDSHTKSDVVGFEDRADGRSNVLKGWRLKLYVIAILTMPVFAFFMFKSLYAYYYPSEPTPEPSDRQASSASSAQSSQQSQVAQSPPVKQKPKPRRTVAGQFLAQFPTLTISSNSIDYPDWVVFDADLGDRRASFTLSELNRLGDIEVRIVSQCVIQLKSGDVTTWAYCAKEQNATEVFGVPVAETPQA